MSSGLPSKADIARCSRHVANVVVSCRTSRPRDGLPPSTVIFDAIRAAGIEATQNGMIIVRPKETGRRGLCWLLPPPSASPSRTIGAVVSA